MESATLRFAPEEGGLVIEVHWGYGDFGAGMAGIWGRRVETWAKGRSGGVNWVAGWMRLLASELCKKFGEAENLFLLGAVKLFLLAALGF